jgi:hypothetical protein
MIRKHLTNDSELIVIETGAKSDGVSMVCFKLVSRYLRDRSNEDKCHRASCEALLLRLQVILKACREDRKRCGKAYESTHYELLAPKKHRMVGSSTQRWTTTQLINCAITRENANGDPCDPCRRCYERFDSTKAKGCVQDDTVVCERDCD